MYIYYNYFIFCKLLISFIAHHKTTSYNEKRKNNLENLTTEISKDFESIQDTDSSKIVLTEGGEALEEPMFSSFQSHKKSYARSHVHISKSNKVSFDPQISSTSQGSSPHKNFSWFGQMEESKNAPTKQNESKINENQLFTNITDNSSINLNLNGKEEKTKSKQHNENGQNNNENLSNGKNSTNQENQEEAEVVNKKQNKTSPFRGLMKFQSSLSGNNPFFLSSMGFTALSTQDSSSMFRSVRNLKSTMKLTKGLKDSSQVLYHLPIEKPLLSKEDLEFIEKMIKSQNEEQIKIINSENKHEKVKRKTLEVDLDGQEWEISEYQAKDFNLDNVYKNFLIDQKPQILLPIRNSSERSETSTILPSVIEKECEDSATIRRVTNNHLKIPMTSKNSPNKKSLNFTSKNNDDIADFLSTSVYESNENQNQSLEDEILRLNEIVKNCKKFKEIQNQDLGVNRENAYDESVPLKNPGNICNIIENIRLNVCVKINNDENEEIFAIGKISFFLTQAGLFLLGTNPLILDFSGNRLVEIIINHKTHKQSFEDMWKNNKILISIEELALGENNITFLTGTKIKVLNNPLMINDLSKIHPFFEDIEKTIDVHMTWLYPNNLHLISSFPHLFSQKLSEFEIDSSLSLHNYVLTKIRCDNAKKNQAFILGEFEEILVNDAFNFYCMTGFKKIFVKKSMGLSDVLRLAEVFYNNYFKSLKQLKTNLRLVFVHQKEKIRIFQGLNLLKSSYMTKEEKFPEFLYLLLKLLLKEIFLYNEINLKAEYSWVFHGLSGFLILHFFEKPMSSSFEIPINEIKLLLIQGKASALQQNLTAIGSHSLNEKKLDIQQIEDPITVFKSLYLFQQLSAYIGKKAIHEVLMELDYKHFTVKLFLEKLTPYLRENEFIYFKKWLGNWICNSGVQEIEFEIFVNPQRPLFLNELVILQRPLIWSAGSNELNYHFLALALINNAGMTQFALEIVIPNTGECCVAEKIKGKYVPKALILDPDETDYFIQKLDAKTHGFLIKNIYKIHDFKMRANCYITFYFEVLLGKMNILDFFDIISKGLEIEPDFMILKILCKYCKEIYRVIGHEEIRKKMFNYFHSALESKKFRKKEGFFLANAIFYCKTPEEFDLLEKCIEKMDKPQGFLPIIPTFVKFLWKRVLFYEYKEQNMIEAESAKEKNKLLLEKITNVIESEVSNQIKKFYKTFSSEINLNLNFFYDTLLNNLIDEEYTAKTANEIAGLHIMLQIFEEFSICYNDKIDPMEFSDINKKCDEMKIWYIIKYAKKMMGKEKIDSWLINRNILERIVKIKNEVEERIINSLKIAKTISI